MRFWVLILAVSLPGVGSCQTVDQLISSGDGRPDALALLQQVADHYSKAKYFHIEALIEEQMNGEFSRSWQKSLITAVFAPGNRYRFESRSQHVWWIQVSDGTSEWIYQPIEQQYMKRSTSGAGPFRFKGPLSYQEDQLMEAQDLAKNLSDLPVRSAVYLPDETIVLNGNAADCYVIGAEGRYRPGWSSDTTSHFTYWIDKRAHVIRKVNERMEGALIPMDKDAHYVQDTTTTYPVADLDAATVPDGLFTFPPVGKARLVQKFSVTVAPRSHANLLVGKTAPSVNLVSTDGHTMALDSFRGQPVLLDFWATWCSVCTASMPSLARLHRDFRAKGLVVLSIDEDDEAKRASDFLAKRAEPWTNFHDDGEIARAFAGDGIPQFVLIDSSGKIVYEASGFDDSELRKAIAKLGQEYGSPKTNPKY